MTGKRCEIDPDGDVELVLSASEETAESIDKFSVLKPIAAINESSVDTDLESHVSAIQKVWNISDQSLHIRVSSKHLTLASPVFKAMFQIEFKEGQQLSSHGHVELALPEDNPMALLVLLNLIHGKFRVVPRKLSLWMLTKLAILVDKYEILESTELLLNLWFEEFESNTASSITDDLLPLMCVSWVFKRSSIFKEVTQRAQLESKDILEVETLPVPGSILSMVPNSIVTIKG